MNEEVDFDFDEILEAPPRAFPTGNLEVGKSLQVKVGF